VVVVLNFLLPRFLPGDPLDVLGAASATGGLASSTLMWTQLRATYHLDAPLRAQFGLYLRGPHLPTVVIVLGLLSWPAFARIVRAQVRATRTAPFVEAAYALGARRWRGSCHPRSASSCSACRPRG
jgi:ABC-type dipeptide/oligopeptide/nickel transport system permease subunit